MADIETLISLIRDSEIVNENNWGTRDVMSPFIQEMVVRNPYFQNANFPPGERDNTVQFILGGLNGILVKRNVSNNEFKIQKRVSEMQHPHIQTPRIISYVRGPYPIPYPMSYRNEGNISVAGPFLTEEKRSNIMIMERVNGNDLATIYGSGDGDTPNPVYERCRNIIITLRDEGIIYPDITSYNFMLDTNPNPNLWIIDFGHAREVSWFIGDFIDGNNGWNPDMA
jgi:hypothetical protein